MATTTDQPTVISISKSYHDSVEIFLNHFVKLVSVALIPNIITYLLSISFKASALTSLVSVDSLEELFDTLSVASLVSGGIIVIMGVVQILGFIALTYIAVHHERVTVLTAIENSFAYFWRFFGMGIVVTVFTVIGFVLGYSIVAVLGIPLAYYSVDLINQTIVWLGLIPAAISGIFSTLFIFTGYSLVDKEHTLTQALQHSYRLVRGHFWPLITRVLLYYIVGFVVAIALYLVPGIGKTLALVTLTPFSVIYLYVLYRNLATLKE